MPTGGARHGAAMRGPDEHGDVEGQEAQAQGALTSAWHVAVLAGPDTGWVTALSQAGLTLGRGAPAEDEPGTAPARLTLIDPLVSRHHCALRVRRGQVQVRDLGSANGTRVTADGASWRARRLLRGKLRVRGRWQTIPSEARLQLGSTVVHVRGRPEVLRAPRPPEARTQRRRDWLRLAMPLVMCLVMVPLLLSVSSSWWRWFILAMPIAMFASAFFSGRGPRAEPMPDPATVLLLAASGADPAPPGDALRADLPRASAAGGRRGAARWARGGPTKPRDVVELHDGDRLALAGPGAAGAARWLLGQLATHQGAIVHGAEALLCVGEQPRTPAAAIEDEDHWHVMVADGVAPPIRRPAQRKTRGGGLIHLTVADSLETVPHWCTRVVVAEDSWLGAPWLSAVLGFGEPSEQDSGGQLPAQVTLEELVGPAERVGHEWGRELGLRAALGVGPGMDELDLAAHGPHALVAGTTGSGKSELLLAWMLGLAAQHSPADLQLVLIDYKGGATFGRLAELPHTAGVLTDLEPASTIRAVQSLQAEVRRRERELARVGAKDLATYRARRAMEHGRESGSPMPRLVVVVDEFRELAESHAEILSALVRLAAQGRSLGIHLILATQRPGGSVSGEIRANLTVRICLRVLEAAESQDVVGVPNAARLPRVPGRAVLRADGAACEVQAAWCGEGRWVDEAIAAANSAWRSRALGPPPRPWAPELPRHISAAEVIGATSGAAEAPTSSPDSGGLLLGLADLPGEQRLAPCQWLPGGLLVLGGPRSGRTTALRTLALGALREGMAVHILAANPSRFQDLRAPRLGTIIGSDDPRRAARLLEILSSDPSETLLVVDDAETVAEDLDAVAGAGQGSALLSRTLRDARRLGQHIALAGPPSLAGARWTEPLRGRLVLAPRSVSEALTAGVPREYAGTAALPGRAVLVEPGICTVLQVAIEQRTELAGLPDPSVPRLLPVPAAAGRAEPAVPGSSRVMLGLGGDAAEPVLVDCSPGSVTLVLGPPGSGRTSALNTLATALSERGHVRHLTPEHPAIPAGSAPPPSGAVVVLDDIEHWAPHRLDELSGALREHAVLVAARTETVTSAYRGALTEWRARATLVALSPDSSLKRMVGADLSTAIDPITRRPGLGIVVTHGRAVPIQVAQPPPPEPRRVQSSGSAAVVRTPEA